MEQQSQTPLACPHCGALPQPLVVRNRNFSPMVMCATPGCRLAMRPLSPDVWGEIAKGGLKLEADPS